MTESNKSNKEKTKYCPNCGKRNHKCKNKRSNWSGLNIAAMVVGFVLFWPIGLFILYWIMTGRSVQTLPQEVRKLWARLTGHGYLNEPFNFAEADNSDNGVFNDYQQTQHDRISEIKEEIKDRARRFTDYRKDVKRRADKDEFDQFMGDAPIQPE